MDSDIVRHKSITEEILRKSETVSFFQVVNHGIPEHILEDMVEGVRMFHEQPNEVKSQYYTRDITKNVVYTSNFDLFSAPATNWKDTFFANMAAVRINPEELPIVCRYIILEFSKHVTHLGTRLLAMISTTLGLEPSDLINMGCAERLFILGHYYPACPEPELTLGMTKHSDKDFLTILLQDQIGDLQVHYQNHWVDVAPVPGSLVVNIRHLLQLVSNDRFKSSEHSARKQNWPQNVGSKLFHRG